MLFEFHFSVAFHHRNEVSYFCHLQSLCSDLVHLQSFSLNWSWTSLFIVQISVYCYEREDEKVAFIKQQKELLLWPSTSIDIISSCVSCNKPNYFSRQNILSGSTPAYIVQAHFQHIFQYLLCINFGVIIITVGMDSQTGKVIEKKKIFKLLWSLWTWCCPHSCYFKLHTLHNVRLSCLHVKGWWIFSECLKFVLSVGSVQCSPVVTR